MIPASPRDPDPERELEPGPPLPSEEAFPEADPDEPPPVELWRAVGDVTPWGTVVLALSWAMSAVAVGLSPGAPDSSALVAHGASVTGAGAWSSLWRALTSTFLHSGVSHLCFNAVTLLVLGQAVERVFTRWGLWIAAAWGGTAASLASLAWRAARVDAGGVSLSVGGSGVAFAMGGALLTGAFRLRDRLAPTRARALAASVLFLALPGFASGFERPSTDNTAHAAGLAAGLALGAVLPLSERLGGMPAGGLTRVAGALAGIALAAAFARVLLG